MSRMLSRILLSLLAVTLAACGSVPQPIWEQAGTETAEAEIQAANATAIALGLPSPTPVTPTATPTLTLTPTPPPTATLTPTPAPPTETPTLVPTSTVAPTEAPAASTGGEPVGLEAPMPADFEDKVVAGDPEVGMTIFNTSHNLPSGQVWMCSQCHSVTPDEMRLIGPGLFNVGVRAETRVADQDAIEYIYTSITHPNAFIVPGDPPYPENLMPTDFGAIFSEDDLANLIAYLLTLQ
ncbi:MAG: hypothetical protein IT320_13870 [Anaerolineae bacterium]|nr:hypothetical protein [Anaerolineae bacterium]